MELFEQSGRAFMLISGAFRAYLIHLWQHFRLQCHTRPGDLVRPIKKWVAHYPALPIRGLQKKCLS